MAKLKPEIKKLWCDALRSGEWEQTVGMLEWGDSYCCLGVLTKLTGTPDDLEQADELPPFHLANTWFEPERSVYCSVRDPQVQVEVEEFDADGELLLIKRYVDLTQLNDEYQYTFAQIADLIEEQL